MRKKLAAFRLDPELVATLEAIGRKTGAPLADQVRRAIQTWMASQRAATRSEGKRQPPAGGPRT